MEAPNGLRLSGARKGVRCSRGLGHGATFTLSPLGGRILRAYRSRTRRFHLAHRPRDTNDLLGLTRTDRFS